MRNSCPKVTICLQSYNCAPVIRHTLDSLIMQDYPNFEILIFDDSSTDNTLEILSEYKKKYHFISYYQNKKEINTTNFNQYLKNINSYGEFFTVFHSDDIYEPNIISNQVDFLKKYKDAICVSTDANTIDINNNFIGAPIIPEQVKKKILIDYNFFIDTLFTNGFFLMMPSFMYRTGVMKKKKFIFEYNKWGWSADIAFCLEITKYGKIGFINKKLLNYRVSNLSNSQKLRFERVLDSDLFKILDSIIEDNNSKNFNNELRRKKDFLLMHDRAITGVNLILQDKKINNIFLLKNFYLSLNSFLNFKKFIIATIVKIISIFPFRKYLLKKIIKFNPYYKLGL